MQLNYREFGEGPPLVVVHGLFGSASNWQSIAKRLADAWRVLCVDLRNHGESPHHEDMSYTVMADDLRGFIKDQAGGCAPVVGHSMGGKAAMTLALEHPEVIPALIVADVAPATYGHRFTEYLDVLMELPVTTIANRREADAWLADSIPEAPIRAFLLHNLRQGENGYRWRINLDALCAHVDDVAGFPVADKGLSFAGPTLFLRGGRSDYLQDKHHPAIAAMFPDSSIETIEEAGHWLHAEKPDEVAGAFRDFLTDALN